MAVRNSISKNAPVSVESLGNHMLNVKILGKQVFFL